MDLKDLIKSEFVSLSGDLKVKDAITRLAKGTYGVVVEGREPIAIATAEKLKDIARTNPSSLLQAARDLPKIIYTGLDFGRAGGEYRRIATVVIAVPGLEPELRERAKATNLMDIGRGGLVLGESGAGFLPFEEVIGHLDRHRGNEGYQTILNNLESAHLIGGRGGGLSLPKGGGIAIGASGSGQYVPGSGAGYTPPTGVTCETCGCLNVLAAVPSCDERPKKCQNPKRPPHPLKIPGCDRRF